MVSSIFSPRFGRLLPSFQPTKEAEIKAAIDSDRIEDAIEIFKSDSSLVEKPLPNGELPLNYAIRREKFDLVKRIFQEMKPNVDTKDHQGLTFIDHAMLGQNPAMKTLVLECFLGNGFGDYTKQWNEQKTQFIANDLLGEINKARLSCTANPPEVHLAAKGGDLTKLQNFVKSDGNINQSDRNGLTPLHYACLFGRSEAAEWMLKHGARVDLLSNDRKSALHFAAIGGDAKIIEILLASTKLSPNVRDANQRTPLHYAVLTDHLASAAMLIQKGSNPLDQQLGVTPIALLMHRIQKQSNLRDSLKLDGVSKIIFMGFMGSWMFALSDDVRTALQAMDLVNFIPMISLSFNNLSRWDAIKMRFLLLAAIGARNAQDPEIQSMSSVLTASVAWSSSLEGIKRSWKGLTYETYRPLRNIVVHAFNGISSLSGLAGRIYHIQEGNRKENCFGTDCYSFGCYTLQWNEELGRCESTFDRDKSKEFCEQRDPIFSECRWEWNEQSETCDSYCRWGSPNGNVPKANLKYGASVGLCNVGDWKAIGDCIRRSGENLHTATAYRSDAAKVLPLPITTQDQCEKQARKAFRTRSVQYHIDKCGGKEKDVQDWCIEVQRILNRAQEIACDTKYRYSAIEL